MVGLALGVLGLCLGGGLGPACAGWDNSSAAVFAPVQRRRCDTASASAAAPKNIIIVVALRHGDAGGDHRCGDGGQHVRGWSAPTPVSASDLAQSLDVGFGQSVVFGAVPARSCYVGHSHSWSPTIVRRASRRGRDRCAAAAPFNSASIAIQLGAGQRRRAPCERFSARVRSPA